MDIQSETLRELRALVGEKDVEMDGDASASVDHESIASDSPLPFSSSSVDSRDSIVSSIIRESRYELMLTHFSRNFSTNSVSRFVINRCLATDEKTEDGE